MFGYAALLATVVLMNPFVVNSEPIQLNKFRIEAYETAGGQTELIAQNPVKTVGSGELDEEIFYVDITGYSSTPEETDSTPFITASGTHVRPGVAAANWLPLGTKIKIPELFKDQVFTIEDRMHPRLSDRVDIWFPDKESAKLFGKNKFKREKQCQICVFTSFLYKKISYLWVIADAKLAAAIRKSASSMTLERGEPAIPLCPPALSPQSD